MLKPIPEEKPAFTVRKVRPVKKRKYIPNENMHEKRKKYKEDREKNIIRMTAIRLLKHISTPAKKLNRKIIGELIEELQKLIICLQNQKSRLVSEEIKNKDPKKLN